jgi:hypothetical protein
MNGRTEGPFAGGDRRRFDEDVWAAATWGALFTVQFVVALAIGVISLLWRAAGIDPFGPIWYRAGTALAALVAAVIAGLAAGVLLLRARSSRARAFGLSLAVSAVIVLVSGMIVARVLHT